MASLLVKAIDATDPDPERDAHMYKRGDVVVVMPDGHVWGNEEGLPRFVRVTIPDLPEAHAEALVQPEYVEGAPVVKEDGTSVRRQVLVRRRTNRLDLDALPRSSQTDLAASGSVVLPFSVVRSALVRKATGDSL